MATTYGLTAQGFVPKRLSTIASEIEASLRTAFGQNINLLPESVFGQLVGIFSEREALLWELGEAVYASQYPSGAEGTSVDNILALNNLRRLGATPTITSPTENNVPGLVLYGTPGTIVPAGSIISVFGTPTVQFSLDATVTIGSPVDAVQAIVFSNVPDTGQFTLSIDDPSGNTLTTPVIPYDAQAALSVIGFSSVPVTGSFQITLTKGGAALTTAAILYTDNAAAVQAAIQALSGYGSATVSGDFTAGFTIDWGATTQPLVTITANTLGVTATPVDSLQAQINNLYDSSDLDYPYTDVLVSGSFTVGFMVSFGAGSVLGSNPSSGDQPQPDFVVASNSLQQGITVTNISVTTTQAGLKAQAIGSATCTATGPNFVPANTLNVIGSPVSGWDLVTNPLDCLTGTNIETDTEALARRTTLLAAQANGPLQSIVEKVAQVPFVTAAIGFENLTLAANQLVEFSAVPTAGNFTLQVGGQNTPSFSYTDDAGSIQTAIQALPGLSDVLVTGSFYSGFTIDFNGVDGGQQQPLTAVVANTLTAGGAVSITTSFSRPGKSFEIVAQGGSDQQIAEAIYGAKPAGIESYGSTSVQITDAFGNPYSIDFSRPTPVDFYVVIALSTDLYNGAVPNPSAKFNPQSVQTIQQDIAAIGNAVPIGGLVVGFGSDGLIGAFNNVPGIRSYTLYFDRAPAPSTNTNVQLQAKELALFETFNIIVSYT